MRTTKLLVLLLLWPALTWAQWSEPAIDGSLRSAPLTPPPVTGTTYYVDKDSKGGTCNNANAGTLAQPWCTIGKAMATLTAGQRAYIRSSAVPYAEGDLDPANNGAAGTYITFEAYPGETPVLNCSGFTWCFKGDAAGSASYIVVKGLEMRNPNVYFMYCIDNASQAYGCHHWWFVDVIAHETNLSNTAVAYSGFDFASHHIVVSHSTLYNISGEGIYTGVEQGAHDLIFEFNTVHDTGHYADDGGGIKCGTGSWNCIIRYNIAYNNYRHLTATSGCYSGAPPANCVGSTGLYFDIDTSQNHAGAMSYMYNNIAYDNDMGLQATASPSMRIFNNLAFHNGFTEGQGTWGRLDYGRGLHVACTGTPCSSGYVDVQIYHNTIVGNYREGLWVQQASEASAPIILRNNLFQNNAVIGGTTPDLFLFTGAADLDADYDLIYNTNGAKINWNNTLYNSVALFLARAGGPHTTYTHAITSAATFTNLSGPTNTWDFRATGAGNAQVNAGVTVASVAYDLANTTRPQPPAGAPDLGAYEYGLSNSPPSCAITTDGGNGAGNNFIVTSQPLTTLEGTAGDSDGSVSSVAVSCAPSCGSPTVTGLGPWSVATVPLSGGANAITVTVTDNEAATCQDSVIVTFNPPPPPAAQFRLIQ